MEEEVSVEMVSWHHAKLVRAQLGGCSGERSQEKEQHPGQPGNQGSVG